MDENTNETIKQEQVDAVDTSAGTGSTDTAGDSTGTTASYTGEYGNTVEGQQPSSSVYSYSYKDNQNSATHSGDYYAGQTGAGQAQPNGQGQPAGGMGQAGTADAQNGYANSGQGNYNNSYNNWQNNGYYSNQNPYPNQNNGDRQQGREKKPKGGSFGKKLAACAALAVVFGLVAGICFQGVNYVAGKGKKNVQIGSTRDNQPAQSDSDNTVEQVKPSAAPGNSKTGITDVSGIVEQTMPAIVAITSTTTGTSYTDLFGQIYQGQDTTSCGSGFIVGQSDTELLIVTNNHVIDGAKTISVQFIDSEVYEADTKGTDTSNDLAVIAIPLKKIKDSTMEEIKIADLGNSDDLKVGEMAIAIGNALGYGQSVTVGYISAKDREIQEASESGSSVNTIKAIQTDAAINPGNSGGALLNLQGQVIGINSAKIAASTVEGVGYAIPISQAIPIIDNLKTKENLSDNEKGYLGIKGQTVSEEASTYNMPNGVYVMEVAEKGAAAEGGIKTGDIITAIENMEVRSIESLVEKANSYRKGTEVEITLQRSSDGVYKEKKVKVKLQGKSSLNGLSDDDTNNQSGSNGNSGNGNNGNDNNGNNGNNGNDFGGFFNPFGY